MTYSRRQFLGVLGAGGAATAGLSQLTTAQDAPVVEMGNNYFDPIGLNVEPGTTVRFEIEAGSHSATAYAGRVPSDATAFDSGIISQGSFEHTFETTGTYDYYCIPHKSIGMVGRIVVGTPGGPAEDDSIPDGDVPDSEAIVERGTVPYETFADGDGDTGDGMMGPGMGPGMMNDRGGGWFGRLPIVGGILGTISVVGGALYWALNRGTTGPETDDAAVETLRERHARGELDDEEYHRRRKRLENEE